MTRIGRLTVFLLVLFMVTGGCGGDEETSRKAIPDEGEQAATTTAQAPQAQESSGRPAIPPTRPEAVEGLSIAPYFDEAGTVTEMAVAPGELFTVYICVEHPGYDMNLSQYRMHVPDGVNVIGESKAFENSLSIGNYKEMYVMTYPCQHGSDKYRILRYSCIATEEFQGGVFETVKASTVHGHSTEPPFIGFVTCGDSPEQVPAYGGSATLTRK